MKQWFYLLIILLCLVACRKQQPLPKETVTKYYQARNAGDFKAIKTCVTDSITITEGDYVMPYDPESFYEVYKWDSIFQPSYKIVSLEENEGKVIAEVTINSLRNDFLKNQNMTCTFKFNFDSHRIASIAVMDCADADWALWEQERDSLVNWIDGNHPRLNGFINDMTMQGALKYLEAIALYEAEKNSDLQQP